MNSSRKALAMLCLYADVFIEKMWTMRKFLVFLALVALAASSAHFEASAGSMHESDRWMVMFYVTALIASGMAVDIVLSGKYNKADILDTKD